MDAYVRAPFNRLFGLLERKSVPGDRRKLRLVPTEKAGPIIPRGEAGGPDSNLPAACRYLTQRFSMPDNRVKATCNDIGTEEIAHWEMIGTMIHQCLRDATLKDIEAAGLMGYYTMHSKGVYPADPNGVPFTAAYLQCTGDPIADITEDMAADAAMSKRQHFAQKKEALPRMAVLLSPLY